MPVDGARNHTPACVHQTMAAINLLRRVWYPFNTVDIGYASLHVYMGEIECVLPSTLCNSLIFLLQSSVKGFYV